MYHAHLHSICSAVYPKAKMIAMMQKSKVFSALDDRDGRVGPYSHRFQNLAGHGGSHTIGSSQMKGPMPSLLH